jgi:hypothetical protein
VFVSEALPGTIEHVIAALRAASFEGVVAKREDSESRWPSGLHTRR